MKLKNGHRDLVVWQKAMDLADATHALTKLFPRDELYGLISQMRRSAVSIPSNIAEGSGRKTMKDFRQFLSIAYGSALELETQLLLSQRFAYCTASQSARMSGLLTEVLKMLNKMTTPPPAGN